MLACRVCLAIGESDPEQWLEDVPERVFELWEAFYAVEPWGDERRLLAKLIDLMALQLGIKGGIPEHANMPWTWIHQPEPELPPTPEESVEAARQMLEKKY